MISMELRDVGWGAPVILQIGITIEANQPSCIHVINGMLLRSIRVQDVTICLDCLKTALAVAGRPL